MALKRSSPYNKTESNSLPQLKKEISKNTPNNKTYCKANRRKDVPIPN
jgi:hypothetical protein